MVWLVTGKRLVGFSMSATRKRGGGLKEQLDSWLDTWRNSGDFEDRHKKTMGFLELETGERDKGGEGGCGD